MPNKNPLNDVPLNTKKTYVTAVTKSGCKIIMPVDSDDEETIQAKKQELQDWIKAYGSNSKST